jgi:transcription factor IIIB subunit 2
VIGTLYIKLLKKLELKVEIIDPSLYMHRFCNKFNFGNYSKDIERTALKILQFIKRDWIATGRRPSGLCGACILISAKLHKFNIDIKILADAVHVCPQTIQNRIEEFSLTKVASMTLEQFQIFKESHFYPESDPPAFLKNLMKEEKKEEIKENEKNKEFHEKIENGASSFDKSRENGSTQFQNGSNNNININNANSLDLKKYESLNLKKEKSNSELTLNNKAKSESFNLRPRPTSKIGFAEPLSLRKINTSFRSNNTISERRSLAEEKLSVIPENEEYKYLFSKEEYGIRKQFWEIMFKDWIEQQKEREEKEGKEKKINMKEPRKRNKKMILKSGSIQKTPYEAIKSSNKFGKKINYSYIKSIMSKRK